jgi:hypothetical protein
MPDDLALFFLAAWTRDDPALASCPSPTLSYVHCIHWQRVKLLYEAYSVQHVDERYAHHLYRDSIRRHSSAIVEDMHLRGSRGCTGKSLTLHSLILGHFADIAPRKSDPRTNFALTQLAAPSNSLIAFKEVTFTCRVWQNGDAPLWSACL